MKCTQPFCTGTIVDGYCDVCGMVASAAPPVAPPPLPSVHAGAGTVLPPPAPPSGPPSSRTGSGISGPVLNPGSSITGSSRLGSVPFGSARAVTGTRPTRRLDGRGTSRLGAGLTQVPAIPIVDPRQALMDPPVVSEDKRFCSVCGTQVGRSREGQPGRTKGFCPKCRTQFDFEPQLAPGAFVGGQYEVVGCLAHGGMGWIYLARDRNVNDRWVVLKGLLNTGDPDASRAAAAEKQYLAEVEHPLIVEIYNFVAAADGAFYIVMEYVGGRSLNNLLKDRMVANGGRFSAVPVDQAIAYLVEMLPAFSYLHSLGLLFCDFKPANVIQVGDGLKLIDLGGMRRADDDLSPIYGTVGFQAPEVARDGCTVASDMYTVARTLAVLTFEFKGYQTKYVDSLPSSDEVPLFADHDSLYRWLLKGTATRPEDRFQSAEEMRDQLLGVLRDVTAGATGTAPVTRSTPSRLFDTPAIANDELDWDDLPAVTVDPSDPMAAFMANVTAAEPGARVLAYDKAPEQSTAVLLGKAYAALELEQPATAEAGAGRVLANDPWEWRGVWIQGLAAMLRGDPTSAVSAFNAVYGQLPGELAPKLALARSCELAGETLVAQRMYSLCARSDAAYVAPAQFGLARLAAANGQRAEALSSLERIPATSRAYGDARRKRAVLLASAIDYDHAMNDLGEAANELEQATMEPRARVDLRIQILASALDLVERRGPSTGGSQIAGIAADEPSLRRGLEQAYREAARLSEDAKDRIRLVDLANAVRPRTLV
ncbi:MAG: tetratricopeptide repeat protein [Ilumatobacteraceae bacterium]